MPGPRRMGGIALTAAQQGRTGMGRERYARPAAGRPAR
jgi:hypothetical protein